MADESREWTKFGRYALLQKIGSGGMAEIYRAKTFGAAGFEKEFAIKLILPSLVNDSEFVEMFINEAKLAVNLYHANIVQVFDLGELNNQYYIAMEYVHGKDLLDILARCAELNIKIPLDLVLFIGREMLKGLDFAHRAKDPYGEPLNIIHRDVSPSNIMISYAGDVKVGDFGVAKAAIERTLTESGTLKGKVGYMSPEQVMGEEIDSRSDLFSAGIVLFEALSMNRLFIGGSDLDVMLKVRDADIEESLRKTGPLPRELVDIICRGLTKHREDRFQTGGEFYQALVDFCFQRSIKVTGSDLSNFMRRLFAKEIEAEKAQRRSEPGGEALSREMAKIQQNEQKQRQQQQEVANRSSPATAGADTTEQESSAKTRAPSTPAEPALQDTANFQGPDASKGPAKAGIVDTTGQRPTKNKDPAPASAADKKYRYRDDSGLVFGPMGPKTLVDLLRVRRPRREDRISVDQGPWKGLEEVSEIDLKGELNLSERRARRQVSVESEAESVTDHYSAPADDSSSDTQVMDGREMGTEATEVDEVARDQDTPKLSGVIDTPRGTLANSSTDLAPPPEMQDCDTEQDKDLGAMESPVAQSAPNTEDVSEGLASDTLQEMKEQYASYEGELAKSSVARILSRLHLAGETGRLHVEKGDIEKSIFLREGEPIYISSNRDEELLGRFLRSRDLITEEQLQEALERLSEWGGRLGDALVAIGAIPAHSIFEHLSAQMREKLLELFSWEGGHYGYFENQEPDTQGYSMGLNTFETIVVGCRERVSIDRIRNEYKKRTFVSIYPNTPPPFDVDRLGLRGRELRVLNELQSGDTLESLLERFSTEQQETVYRTFYLLHQVEIISFEITEKVDLPPVPED